MRTMPVLLIRPRADALRLAEDLRVSGITNIEISPLIDIAVTGPLPDLPGGIVLTSGNAVDAYVALDGPRRRPAWTVGPRTADRARAAGLDVRGVAPDASALAGIIPLDAPPLTHLRGSVVRGDLVGALRARGLTAMDAVVYNQTAVDLTDAARTLLEAGPVVVPLYSPRSAELFATACQQQALPNLRIVALSNAVAQICPVPPVQVAKSPDGAAMLRAILQYFGNMDG